MIENLDKILEECKIDEPQKFIDDLNKLYELLIEYNKNVNLTRITEYDDFLIKHVIDSLIIVKFFPYLAEKKLTIADIGCGAGFPSIILAMAYKNLTIHAIDSIAKKTRFVEFAAQELNLSKLKVITGRSNELNRKDEFKFKYDIVTARAVAEAKTIYNDAQQFIKRDKGKFILYKTPEQLAEDLPKIRQFDRKHNWRATEVYELPNEAGSRKFLYF